MPAQGSEELGNRLADLRAEVLDEKPADQAVVKPKVEEVKKPLAVTAPVVKPQNDPSKLINESNKPASNPTATVTKPPVVLGG